MIHSMKFDDASFHSDGNFPEDLPPEAGATHIGMFLTWLIINDLESDWLKEEAADGIASLKSRLVTPGSFTLDFFDGKFTDEDVSETGKAFTLAYFDLQKGAYIDDYHVTLSKDLPSVYHTEDSWENYDKLSRVIDQRYSEWKGVPKPLSEAAEVPKKKPWWKLK